MTKKSMEHCLRYIGKPRCRFTERDCNDEIAQTCDEYRSDEGTYLCPYCNRKGLKALNYGSDEDPEIVWECLRCGAELWYCETVEEMLKRCEEVRKQNLITKGIVDLDDDVSCGDCACFHPPTDLCTYKREKVDYRQGICGYFIWR